MTNVLDTPYLVTHRTRNGIGYVTVNARNLKVAMVTAKLLIPDVESVERLPHPTLYELNPGTTDPGRYCGRGVLCAGYSICPRPIEPHAGGGCFIGPRDKFLASSNSSILFI